MVKRIKCNGILRTLRSSVLMSAWIVALAACGGDGGSDPSPQPPPPPPGPPAASAVIGAAGGTLTGPDGVQLIVPAGALSADTTLRIARSSAGAPALPDELRPDVPIYEVTPHDLAFLRPVQLRLPLRGAPQADATVLVASPTEAWAAGEVRFDGNTAVIERSRLSWYSPLDGYVLYCSPRPGDPYPCILPGVAPGAITTTPAGAIAPPASITDVPTLTGAATLNFDISYGAQRDCGNARLRVSRIGPGAPTAAEPRGTVLLDEAVPMNPTPGSNTRSGGTRTFQTPVDSTLNGFVSYEISFSCTRAFGNRRVGSFTLGGYRVNVPAVAAPAVTTQPANATVVEPAAATFSVVATGTAPLTYQWARNVAGTWTSLSGATNPSYTLPATTRAADDGAQFRVTVTNAAATVTSNVATLTVSAASAAPVITTQPTGQTTTVGGNATFASAASGAPTPVPTWTINGTVLPLGFQVPFTAGACTGGFSTNGGQLQLIQLSAGCNGVPVFVTYTNAAGSATSTTVTLTVNPANAAPAITVPPVAATTTAGGNASFSVTATGTGPFSYRWTLAAIDLPATGAFASGNCTGSVTSSNGGASITLNNVSIGCDGASVSVTVTGNVSPSASSTPVTLTVQAAVPTQGACFGGPNGWCYVQPLPMANNLTGVVFDATGNGFTVVGDVGTILRSADFGDSATVSWLPSRLPFTDVAAPSPGRLVATALADGASGLWLSTDNGVTWTPTAALDGALAVAFRDSQVGVAVGAGRILRTTNGGDSWSALVVPEIDFPNFTALNSVAYAGNDVFVAVGSGGAVRSTDGGLSWALLPGVLTASPDPTGVVFNGQGVGIATNVTQPVAARSTDFGATWTTVNLPFVAARAAFAGASTVVILSENSRHARSTDGGVTWSGAIFSLREGQQRYWRPFMRDAQNGIAVGEYGAIARTIDGGQSWVSVAGGNINDGVRSLESNPSRTVLLGHLNNRLQRSTDGVTWTDAAGSSFFSFGESISWGSDSVAMVAAVFEGVQLTTNGGTAWTQVRAGATDGLIESIAMADDQIAVVTGYENISTAFTGFVERTTNRGQSWTRLTVPGLTGTNVYLTVRFVSPTLGFMGGDSGARLLRTTNAGASWTLVTLPAEGTQNNASAIRGIRPGPAGSIFLTTDAALLRSTDSGQTFARVLDSSNFGSMTDVKFLNDTVGIATGAGGIWRTNDGGTTWTRLVLPLSNFLVAVAWTGAGDALAGGDGGMLLVNRVQGALASRQSNLSFTQSLRLKAKPVNRTGADASVGGAGTRTSGAGPTRASLAPPIKVADKAAAMAAARRHPVPAPRAP